MLHHLRTQAEGATQAFLLQCLSPFLSHRGASRQCGKMPARWRANRTVVGVDIKIPYISRLKTQCIQRLLVRIFHR